MHAHTISRCQARQCNSTCCRAPCIPPRSNLEQPRTRISSEANWDNEELEPKDCARMACNTRHTWLLNDMESKHARTDNGACICPQRSRCTSSDLWIMVAASLKQPTPSWIVARHDHRADLHRSGWLLLLGCIRSGGIQGKGAEPQDVCVCVSHDWSTNVQHATPPVACAICADMRDMLGKAGSLNISSSRVWEILRLTPAMAQDIQGCICHVGYFKRAAAAPAKNR